MIKPTVGRIVWYSRGPTNTTVHQIDQPLAAQVAYVHVDGTVNLCVLDVFGNHHSRLRVPLIQEGDPMPNSEYCEWMPYQIGQAKKEEVK